MVVMNKQMRCWLWGLAVSAITLATVPLAGAKPPLDLVAGEQSVETLKQDGLIFMRTGFQSLAIESFRGAMALEDKAKLLPSQWDADVPFNLGLLYLNQGDLRGARGAFERSVEADPTNFKAQYQLALVELQMGDTEAAQLRLSLLETASAENPQMQEHLDGLMAALELPAKASDLPPTPQQAEISAAAADEPLAPEPEIEGEPITENVGDPELESISSLTTETVSEPPDALSDDITPVSEIEAAGSESGAAEDAEVATDTASSGLDRFRRED